MSAPDFFRARLDRMIDLRHPRAVRATPRLAPAVHSAAQSRRLCPRRADEAAALYGQATVDDLGHRGARGWTSAGVAGDGAAALKLTSCSCADAQRIVTQRPKDKLYSLRPLELESSATEQLASPASSG